METQTMHSSQMDTLEATNNEREEPGRAIPILVDL
jgi:hypothetical protein